MPKILANTFCDNARKLLGAFHFSITFVDDEDAARRWITEIDRKRCVRKSSLHDAHNR